MTLRCDTCGCWYNSHGGWFKKGQICGDWSFWGGRIDAPDDPWNHACQGILRKVNGK